MNAVIFLAGASAGTVGFSSGYLIGIVIAVLLLGYLVYSLVKPEKF